MRFHLLTLFFTASLLAQSPYPKDYFRSPMDLPLNTSGTFGELRSNHFHAGLDYRTNQQEGFPVYAAADGYISRIKVSSYGYGTSLYIDHPNGFTTLYGHLSAYGPGIEEYVRKLQYEKKSFEVEVFPKPGELVVKQGQIVAYSGNTGGSGGPHLHFEFRDTKTEMIINPLNFGLDKKMKDTSVPTIYGVMAYPLSDDAVVNGSTSPILILIKKQADGSYTAGNIQAKGTIGFGLNATDKSTGSTPNNGIYKVETFFGGSPYFSYTFDTFAFDESRYINNFIDYPRYYKTGQRYQKLFVRTPYELSLLKHNKGNGQYAVKEGKTEDYRIVVADYHGNNVTINGNIAYSDTAGKAAEPKHTTPYLVKAANDNNYTKNNISVYIPAHAFYEDFYMDFDVKDSVLYLHDASMPVHSPITVSFDVSHLDKATLQKTFIGGNTGNHFSYNSSLLEGGRLSAKVKNLGTFKLMQDNNPPKIFSPSFAAGKWLSANKTFSLKISDDMSGIATYDAYLNGKWILMHYDYKTRVIYHNFSDGVVADGRNDLKVVVTDNVGNSTTFESHFFRTQNTTPVENNK
ncbi:peptidase M23 [Flavobacterium akiainvivens]|uniref:Peptidase M23 n=1 Tax=Flavobacterium akiainvivens TaxID=1202724 RepID=A0A0M9VI26_9FLAO|nr:M23 family metallopeptidase [Flavobacterium akiainvivens]KOS06200.1 peptidase M23 [Flavobacterium akiainvivens]SFQ68494.1 Peptidase family M23 [Flavobacterium akiainvivens]